MVVTRALVVTMAATTSGGRVVLPMVLPVRKRAIAVSGAAVARKSALPSALRR